MALLVKDGKLMAMGGSLVADESACDCTCSETPLPPCCEQLCVKITTPGGTATYAAFNDDPCTYGYGELVETTGSDPPHLAGTGFIIGGTEPGRWFLEIENSTFDWSGQYDGPFDDCYPNGEYTLQGSGSYGTPPATVTVSYVECPLPVCVAGAPCGECDDVTPLNYRVTLSGITACTACFTVNGTDVKVEFIDNVNSVFILDQSLAEPCLWYFQTPTDYVRISVYFSGDGTCNSGGAPDVVIEDQLRLEFQAYSTFGSLEIRTGSGGILCGFAETLADPLDLIGPNYCAGSHLISNAMLVCGGDECDLVEGDFDQALNGTAYVECITV